MGFGAYSDDYVNVVSEDDDTYPPGTTFMETGNIQIVKPDGAND